MSAPANIRVNTSVPFPSLVIGSGPITLAKANGVWTVGFSVVVFGSIIPPAANYATDFLLGYDSLAQSFFKVSLSNLVIAASVSSPSFDAAAGDYNVINETTLLINKVVPAAHNIKLPTAASRIGSPILIKDFAGNAATNIATIVPNGSEKIDGLTTLPINSNYGGFKLVPITTGGWYISP